jgi:alpha-beta hydrolase superfamily lysophospholipase
VAVAPQPLSGMARGDRPGFGRLPKPQFRDTVANTVGESEAEELYERYAVPAPGRLLNDLQGSASEAAVTADSARGPLLLVSGQEDRMVPDAATRAVYKRYGDSTATTDLKQFADRGHSLIVDSGWPEIADHVRTWLADHDITAAESEA